MLDVADRHRALVMLGVVRTMFDVDDDPIELDEVSAALVDALERFDDEERRKKPLRIPEGFEGGGRFRSLSDAIFKALDDWANGKGPDNPFEGLKDVLHDDPAKRREQLRKAAKARGLTLRRGATENEIANALLDDVRKGKAGKGDAHDVPDAPDAKPTAKKRTPAKKAVPAGPERLSDDPAVRRVQVDNRIREAYSAVLERQGKQPGDWVGLADLRDELGESTNRHEVDAALIAMGRGDYDGPGDPNIVPESNQKALTQADRDAAVTIGDQQKHALRIGDPSPRPLPDAKPAPTPVKKATPRAPAQKAAPKEGPRDFSEMVDRLRKAADSEEAVAEALRDVRAEDVRELAYQLNLDLPTTLKTATARKQYIAETLASHKRRMGGFKAPPPPRFPWMQQAPDPEQAGRDEQAAIDHARRFADTAGELDELLGHEASDEALLSRLEAAGRRHGISDELAPVLDAVRARREVEVENRIRAAYRAARGPGGTQENPSFVSLADIRDALPDLSREEQDKAIDAIRRQDGVRVIPVHNTKALTEREWAAALRIGGSGPSRREGHDLHVLSIQDPAADRPLPDPRAAMARLLPDGVTQDSHAGASGRFDPKVHAPISGSIRQGAPVEVVRPGFTLERDGKQVRLSKAVVEEVGEPAAGAAVVPGGGDPDALTPGELVAIGKLSTAGKFSDGGWVRVGDMAPADRANLESLAGKGFVQKHTAADGVVMFRIDPRPGDARGPDGSALTGQVLPADRRPEPRLSLTQVNRGAIIEGYRNDDGTFGNVPEDGTADPSRVVRVVVQRQDPVDENGEPAKAIVQQTHRRIIGHDAATGRRIESEPVAGGSYWSWVMNPDTDTSADIEGELVAPREPIGAPPADATTPDPLSSLRTLDPEATRDALDLRKVEGPGGLKAMLRDAGLPVSGRKRELVDRLVGHVHGEAAGAGVRLAQTGRGAGALTRAQKAAVSRYGSNDLVPERINGRLRRGGSVTPEIAQMDAAMAASQTEEDLLLYRGINELVVDGYPSRGPGAVRRALGLPADQPLPDSLVDHEFTEPGFSSATTRRGIAEIFGTGDQGILLEIQTPQGTHAVRLPGGEDEILLDRGMRFRVVGDRIDTVMVGLSGDEPLHTRVLTVEVVPGPGDTESLTRDERIRALVATGMTWKQAREQVKRQGGTRSLDEQQRDRVLAWGRMQLNDELRALGHDVTPGHDQLHHWWVYGAGRARWHDWTSLYNQLAKIPAIGPVKAKVFASAWFHERFGYWPGDDRNRVKHGKPPRGHRVGPG